MAGAVSADSDDLLVILEEQGEDRRALGRSLAARCPHGVPKFKCWTCSPPSHEELWDDFLDQYPNQRNAILREGREAFGFPSAGGAA